MTAGAPHKAHQSEPEASAADFASTPATEMLDLSREECLRLLTSNSFGRLAVSRGEGAPVIRPVNYLFDRPSQAVFFRTALGSKFHALLRSADAAFEIDGVTFESRHHIAGHLPRAPRYGRGWSASRRRRAYWRCQDRSPCREPQSRGSGAGGKCRGETHLCENAPQQPFRPTVAPRPAGVHNTGGGTVVVRSLRGGTSTPPTPRRRSDSSAGRRRRHCRPPRGSTSRPPRRLLTKFRRPAVSIDLTGSVRAPKMGVAMCGRLWMVVG
jgi:hypothetical protein